MAKISIDLSTGDLKPEKVALGIDLGTTNSLIAYVRNGKPECIADFGKDVIVPSIVHFESAEVVQVGDEAKPYLIIDPKNTIFSVKRLMGKAYQDLKEERNLLSYALRDAGPEQLVQIEVHGKYFTPVEISAIILKELKNRAEHKLKLPVEEVVITVPAYFNDAQRQATKKAGELAGLKVLRILSEPTAAAIAYGFAQSTDKTQNIAVYDLGGGTFDISILTLENEVFDILATHGDTYLGGDDIDRAIVRFWLNQLHLTEQSLHDPFFAQLIRTHAEKAKKFLSTNPVYYTSIPYQSQTLELSLTVQELEQVAEPIIQKTLRSCEQCLKDSGLKPTDIHAVLLVGGSTRMPYVKKQVEAFFGKKPLDHIDPDQAVALGAAIQANALAGNDNLFLADITPLSLGIETAGGLMDVLIPRNNKIPCQRKQQYTTSIDGQTQLKVAVYQGEREFVKDNRKLAEFNLKGIPAMPAGLPKIEITFKLDSNGILTVHAKELRSQVEQSIEVQPSFGLNEEDIQQNLLASISFGKEDMEQRLFVETQQEAEQMLYFTHKFVENHAALLTAEQKQSIHQLAGQLQQSLSSTERTTIQQHLKALENYTQPIAQQVMQLSIQKALTGKKIIS